MSGQILDHLAALAEPIRTRLLLVLEDRELTVSELCTVLQLPQSTVSRHLKALGDADWVESRAEATSRLYRMHRNGDAAMNRLWTLVRDQASTSPAAFQDHHRLERVLADRRTKSQQFFESSAGEWDRLREELFGGHVHLAGLAGFLDESWVVGDLGCGTGSLSAALAPFVSRVIAIDDSSAMLAAARKRLRGVSNVEVKRGRLESLPIEGGTLDAAALTLVLHHVPEPSQALREVSRALKPGGRVLILDMLPHDRENYRQQMGHVWLGFSEAQIADYLKENGFETIRACSLPAEPQAMGPALAVTTARKR